MEFGEGKYFARTIVLVGGVVGVAVLESGGGELVVGVYMTDHIGEVDALGGLI